MISIIIPVLNEADTILVLLQHLSTQGTAKNISEIIIVDGGSEDDTLQKVENFKHDSDISVVLSSSQKGRAKQMNVGAQKAKGAILYFLHVDSFPPKDFDSFIISEVQKGNEAGCFRMRFNSSHWWLKLAGWLTQFSWRACRGGDQSQFITKSLFEEINGFNEEYIIYEDNILINELYARNQFKVIQETLTTSARRYEEKGIWRLQYHFCMIYIKKWKGATPQELYQYYLKHIK